MTRLYDLSPGGAHHVTVPSTSLASVYEVATNLLESETVGRGFLPKMYDGVIYTIYAAHPNEELATRGAHGAISVPTFNESVGHHGSKTLMVQLDGPAASLSVDRGNTWHAVGAADAAILGQTIAKSKAILDELIAAEPTGPRVNKANTDVFRKEVKELPEYLRPWACGLAEPLESALDRVSTIRDAPMLTAELDAFVAQLSEAVGAKGERLTFDQVMRQRGEFSPNVNEVARLVADQYVLRGHVAVASDELRAVLSADTRLGGLQQKQPTLTRAHALRAGEMLLEAEVVLAGRQNVEGTTAELAQVLEPIVFAAVLAVEAPLPNTPGH